MVVLGTTDPVDLDVMNKFKLGITNPEVLNWTTNDPCGTPSWPYVFCTNGKVTQIQAKNLGLKGTLPQNFNKLSMLWNLGLQNNQLSGSLPTFSGLSSLRYAYLDYNQFDSIPSDFFVGLTSLQVFALDNNPLNATTGWSLPNDLRNSAQLTNLSAVSSNMVGSLPDFLGNMASLSVLKLSSNNISGEIPPSFNGSNLQTLWLNDQNGGGMSGTVSIVATIISLTSLWLHGNRFTGPIPDNIGVLTGLRELNLNGNQLVGLIPDSLANMALDHLDLNNNMFMGPIPKFKTANAVYASNRFCQSVPGMPCAPQVMALLEFLDGVGYPSRLVNSWSGNDPCAGHWLGLSCDANNKVYIINLPISNLNGLLSPAVAQLDALATIRLASNNLTGKVPSNWTELKRLTLLDLSNNNILPPLPPFGDTVKVNVSGNSLFGTNQTGTTPSTGGGSSPAGSGSPPGTASPTPGSGSTTEGASKSKTSKRIFVAIVAPLASFGILIFLVLPVSLYCCKKRKTVQAPSSTVIHPRDPSDSDNMVKIVVANPTGGSVSTATGSGSASRNSSGMGESHVIEAGNLVISVQVLQNVTKNFAAENELGRGGFGVVYKGELDDGTKIAVKRMEAGVISSKALDEFQSEIAVLSKVRHRHLVSLLGYSVEGNERILVYEYMPQGALSKHLFHWKNLKLEPLSWKRSFGVVLMELLTGLMALDEDRPEESQYLAAWFWHIKSNKEKLMAAIDPALDVKEEASKSIYIIAELAGHCTAREPNQRPDMGHAVNVLASLVEKWKPLDDNTEEYSGIDYCLPLNQMVKDWQEAEGKDLSYMDLEDSKGSIPSRPTGFAESFTSADGR
ncbi:Leucine-rich repeat-containing N-terminal, plant-type [Dillenia turbinata]|uniref:Leucine-rich repeat-containing N-terminal, plant-type n=1 Tax=Dillenia turbinata TaxID=194707 RepID=A0AAN8YTD8_9MAGN